MHLGLVIYGVVAVLFCVMVYKIAVRNWIVVHVRRLQEKINEAYGGRCSPMQMTLTPLAEGEAEWNHPKAVKKVTRSLLKLGFEPIGDYNPYRGTYLLMRAFVHPGHSIEAIFYDYHTFEGGVDFNTYYDDDTEWTYTTRWDTRLPHQPRYTIKHYPGENIAVLLERFLAERPAQDIRPIAREDFVERYEADYARAMAWLAERGGYTADECRAMMVAPFGHFSKSVLNSIKLRPDQIAEEEITKYRQEWQEHFRRHFESQADRTVGE